MSWAPYLLTLGAAAGIAFTLAVLVCLASQPRPRGIGFEVKRDD